jgi:hypothetical protein
MTDYTKLIAKKAGIAAQDVRFFAQAVRELTGQNLKYSQIVKNLRKEAWIKTELDQFFERSQALKIAQNPIAYALEIRPEEAQEFIKNISQNFNFPISGKEILEAIQSLEPPKRTVKQIGSLGSQGVDSTCGIKQTARTPSNLARAAETMCQLS